MRILVVVLMLLASPPAWAETSAGDHWGPVRFLLGVWQGTATGQAGDGSVSRQYEFVLRGRFVRETNISRYPAQTGKAQAELHEHHGFFSYDKARNAIVLRQFHVEGFVNQYVMSAQSTSARVVFESERFENFSYEWRARETYDVIGPDEFIETFELAQPGEGFEVYSRNHFRRVKP